MGFKLGQKTSFLPGGYKTDNPVHMKIVTFTGSIFWAKTLSRVNKFFYTHILSIPKVEQVLEYEFGKTCFYPLQAIISRRKQIDSVSNCIVAYYKDSVDIIAEKDLINTPNHKNKAILYRKKQKIQIFFVWI